MRVVWTREAAADLERLYGFLAVSSQRSAGLAIRSLTETPALLLRQPGIGQRVEKITHRTIRRIIVGAYELRYEVFGEEIRILRIFHSREQR